MPDPTIHEIQHDVNTRIAAFGEELAKEIAPDVAALITSQISHLDDEVQGDPLWEDILAPALAWHTLLHLSDNLAKQSFGWADVFFTNLRKLYLKQHETKE